MPGSFSLTEQQCCRVHKGLTVGLRCEEDIGRCARLGDDTDDCPSRPRVSLTAP